MAFDCGDLKDSACGFLAKFFSLIIAILLAISTLLFVVGAGRVMTLERNFAREGFAMFLAMIFAIVTCVFYLVLHFVPRKHYRMLYFLTFLFVTSMFLISLSMGLAAPNVDDCTSLGMLNFSTIYNDTKGLGLGGLVSVYNNATNTNTTIGKLGQVVGHCPDYDLTFAAALLYILLSFVAVFDVQKVLLARVRSKTYGERFVEMGISG